MKKKTKYTLIKKSIYKKIVLMNYESSYDVKRRKDKESIGLIRLYDENIINRVIKRSIDNHFKKILDLLIRIEESDEDPSEGYLFCLDETAKFKRELINKYNRFLKKEQIDFINKKIETIEKETKNKLIAYRLMHSPIFANGMFLQDENIDEYEEERSHSR